MSALVDRLAQYAAYHRDRRNIATHAVGIPMIVLAVTVLLSRPSVDIGGWAVTPAQAAVLAASIYYLRLDLRYGLVMTAVLLASLAMAQPAAAGSTSAWLWVGLGLFVVFDRLRPIQPRGGKETFIGLVGLGQFSSG